MERPCTKGPRSLILTTTERPVAALVTNTAIEARCFPAASYHQEAGTPHNEGLTNKRKRRKLRRSLHPSSVHSEEARQGNVMAIVTDNFTITAQGTGQLVAQMQLSIDNDSRIVTDVSGQIYGQTISGLSDYLNPSNTVYEQFWFGMLGRVEYYFNFENVSVSAGGVQYNIVGSTQPPNMVATVTGSNGSQTNGTSTSQLFSRSLIPPICFVTGTRISTSRGEVAVEGLQVGDMAHTASSGLRPVVWIGHREIDKPAHRQAPVRVRAGAFGPDLPARDLFLSPGHPVLVGADADHEGGVLVPVMCLINGTTITREPVASVTYWHVELDAHDILLAEGLPAESYIDGGDRAFFSEASDHALHNPDFVVPGWDGRCRPVAVDGPLVETERRRLDKVLAADLEAQCEWEAPHVFA